MTYYTMQPGQEGYLLLSPTLNFTTWSAARQPLSHEYESGSKLDVPLFYYSYSYFFPYPTPTHILWKEGKKSFITTAPDI